MDDAELARRLWVLVEHVHAVTYLTDAGRAAYEEVGLRGFWRGYFAGRAAPMGAVGAGPVVATFHGFHPDFVARSVPGVWEVAAPAEVLAARLRGAVAALVEVVPAVAADGPLAPAAAEAADLLLDAIVGCDRAGRSLFAANLDVEPPSDPLGRLWHAATLWREHRGDGHVAALVAAGIGGCAGHVLRLAAQGGEPAVMQTARGWSAEEWEAARGALAARGLVDDGGSATEAGRELRDEIEATTDRLAAEPVARLGPDGADRLEVLLSPLARQVAASGRIPAGVIGIPDR